MDVEERKQKHRQMMHGWRGREGERDVYSTDSVC